MAEGTTGNRLGLPYKPKTRQQDGAATETRILRERGARQHPRSGAGRIKEDGSTEDDLIEVKDANLSFSLKGADLLQTFVRATRQGKNGVWVIKFANGIEAEIRLSRRKQ